MHVSMPWDGTGSEPGWHFPVTRAFQLHMTSELDSFMPIWTMSHAAFLIPVMPQMQLQPEDCDLS